MSLIHGCESLGSSDGIGPLFIRQNRHLWLHCGDIRGAHASSQKTASGSNIILTQMESEVTAVALSRHLHRLPTIKAIINDFLVLHIPLEVDDRYRLIDHLRGFSC